MPQITFNTEAHHVLEIDGKSISGGQSDQVSQEALDTALTDPTLAITVAAGSLKARSRDDLNELAKQAGVKDPEDLPSKDAVIAAINEQPAAGDGEGPIDQPEPQEA